MSRLDLEALDVDDASISAQGNDSLDSEAANRAHGVEAASCIWHDGVSCPELTNCCQLMRYDHREFSCCKVDPRYAGDPF